MKRRWLWILLPLVIGGALGVALYQGRLYNPTIHLRADIAVLAQLCGLGVALVLAGWFLLLDWLEARRGKFEQQVEAQAAEEHRRFLQRLDHEMKNPLTVMQVGLENLGEDGDPKMLESVKTQTLRLSRLVADLRKLSDLETHPIEFASINLAEILKTVVGMTEESRSAKAIKLTLNLPQAPWPLPSISGDGDLLLQAFINLLDNAIKFSEPGDTIEVRASEDGRMVVVEVADTGPGIPEEELPYVWQELYRGESGRGIPGSGLGLALVRVIIERHGGQVNIRSRAEQGTVVIVRLPSAAQ